MHFSALQHQPSARPNPVIGMDLPPSIGRDGYRHYSRPPMVMGGMNQQRIVGKDQQLYAGDQQVILGAGGSPLAILGLDTNRMPPKLREKVEEMQVQALAALSGGAVVEDTHPQYSYRQILPVPATSILAGAQAIITISPQRLFRPENFTIPSNLGPSVDVDSISVGQDLQFVAGGSVPGVNFSEVATDNANLKGTTCNVGQQIIVTVTNSSPDDIIFKSSFTGTCVY